ncbi:MAG: YhcH/YjgK/YiaL family protein [Spirochaetia bacterium]|nr:YhcH/YjgK/YiaL family protein [Spirochaetia bacterium]
MIVDKISNAHLYYKLSSSIEKSLKYLSSTDLAFAPDGKSTIDAGIVIGINQYSTKNAHQGVLEAHRKNIDVQFMIHGAERIGYAFLSDGDNNFPSTEYDEKKDIQFFGAYNQETETFVLQEGMFAIFFPSDLHMPGLHFSEQTNVKKAVIKITV